MPDVYQGYAASAPGARLELTQYEPGPLGPDQVEIKVESCGVCHSDLSMLDNEWGITSYPFIGGHEVIGTISTVGSQVTARKVGERVGLGWSAQSCLQCPQCIGGDHHLCSQVVGTITGRHGGFADYVRAQWIWTTPLPEEMESASAGPLFCGGITVFNPAMLLKVSPTERVGVIGIGGLGHMALKFLRSWGCEVVAFTSTPQKREEALRLGAHQVVNSTDPAEMEALRGSLDFILVTVNVSLDWSAIISTLAPKGRIHFVGATLEPVPVHIMQMIMAQTSLSGSPTGSPSDIATLVKFATRHQITPQVEYFPMTKINDAIQHLRDGKPRYRIVLQADF